MVNKMQPQAAQYLANKYPDLNIQLDSGRFKVDWVSSLPYTDTSIIYYDWLMDTVEYTVTVDLDQQKISDNYQSEQINNALQEYYASRIPVETYYLSYPDQSFSAYFDGDVESILSEIQPSVRLELPASQTVADMIAITSEWQTKCNELHLSSISCQFVDQNDRELMYATATPDTLEIVTLNVLITPQDVEMDGDFRLNFERPDLSAVSALQTSYTVPVQSSAYSQEQFDEDAVQQLTQIFSQDKNKGRMSSSYMVPVGRLLDQHVYTFSYPEQLQNLVQSYEYQFIYAPKNCLISTSNGWESTSTKMDTLSFIQFDTLDYEQLTIQFSSTSDIESTVRQFIAENKSLT